MHEAQLHEENCFITLTYNDENLPEDWSLRPKDFQLFMKRLRKRFGSGIRYYHCGEYGEKNGRPHYHALLFNFDFPDKKLWRQSRENPLYRSEELEKLWPLGHSSIGDATFESAAYVARYILKKRTGPEAEDHYHYVDADGVVHRRLPEYTTMSRRPGIAANWYARFGREVHSRDHTVIAGRKGRPPKFYDEQLEKEDRQRYLEIKRRRKERGQAHEANNTPERRRVREKIQQLRARKLAREI